MPDLFYQSGVVSPDGSNFVTNTTLAASVAGNALTIALKDKAGNDPTQGSSPQIGFRSSTSNSGVYNYRQVTSALSVTIPSGTTIGTVNGLQAYIYVYALDNAGTVELAVSLYNGWDEGSVQSTSAISGGSTATTLYSTSARASVPVRLIGRISVTEATAGTWASAPTEIASLPFAPLLVDGSSLYLNGSFTATVATNNLTFSLKDKNGNAPSASSPVIIGFRSGTAATGTYVTRKVTAALTFTLNSGSSLGMTNGQAAYVYLYALDNGGTVALGCSLTPQDEGLPQSTTGEGGGAATSSQLLYSASAIGPVGCRLIGRILVSEATAGTWASAPTEVTNIPFKYARQIVVSAAVTSNGTLTSTTFTTFTNAPSVTIVAARTAIYKIWGNFSVASSVANTTTTTKVVASAGSPTTIFSQEVSNDQTSANANLGTAVCPYLLALLVAGTSYTFTLNGKDVGSGTATLQNANVTNGTVLVAEEYA